MAASGYTTVSAANLKNAKGTTLADGTIYFTPVNSVTKEEIAFRCGGSNSGPTSKATVSAAVSNGEFTIDLADVFLTSPQYIGYRIKLIDADTEGDLLDEGYGCIQPMGPSFDLDEFDPVHSTPMVTVQAGPPGLNFVGQFATNTFYAQRDVVSYNGSSYYAPADFTSGSAFDPTHWQMFAEAGTFTPSQIGGMESLASQGKRNWFDATKTQSGMIVNPASGAISAEPSHKVTGLVRVPPGGQFVTNVFTAGLAYFDASGTVFVSGDGTFYNSGTVINAPATAVYVVANLNAAESTAPIMFVWGATVPDHYVGFNYLSADEVQADITSGAQAVLEQNFGTVTVNDGSELIPFNNKVTTNFIVYSTQRFSKTRNLGTIAFNAQLAGGRVSLIVSQDNLDGTATVINVVLLPVIVAGMNTFTAGVDFPHYIVPVNALCGLMGDATAGISFVDPAVGATPGFVGRGIYYYASNGAAVGTRGSLPTPLPGAEMAMRFTSTGVTPIPVSALQGKKFGVFPGDSISAGNNGSQVWSQAWQNVVAALTGATCQMQDARWGRSVADWAENYTLSGSVYTRHTSTTSSTAGFASITLGVTVGNTLAQDLTGLDLLIVEIGTNVPIAPSSFGAFDDVAGANTVVGTYKTMLNAIFAANPAMRVFWILPYQDNPGGGYQATQAQFFAMNGIIKQICTLYGIVPIDCGKLPINPATWATYLRDGVHPTDACFANLYGPYIAKILSNESV